jgi:hypothetical protein
MLETNRFETPFVGDSTFVATRLDMLRSCDLADHDLSRGKRVY